MSWDQRIGIEDISVSDPKKREVTEPLNEMTCNNQQLLNAFSVPGTVLSTVHMFSPGILTEHSEVGSIFLTIW